MRARLTLGLIPLEGAGSSDRVDAFAAALGTLLSVSIDLHRAGDYRALAAAIDQDLVDLAWLPPLGAARVLSARRGVAVALAIRDGETSYKTGLFAPAEGRVKTLVDLSGVRAGWVDRESASGYVIIRAALRKSGIRLVDAFSEETFLRTHAEVARALKTGKVDVAATAFHVKDGEIRIARQPPGLGLRADEVRLIAEAGPIPSDIFAVRTAMAPEMISKVQRALVDSADSPMRKAAMELMLADGFARPTSAHAAMIEELAMTLEGPPPSRRPPP